MNNQPSNTMASIESEQCLIGGLLIDPTPLNDVMEILIASDFINSLHRSIWEAITAINEKGELIDIFLISERIGGHIQELVELANSSAGSSNAVAYAKVIAEKSLKRKTLEAANSISRFVLETTQASAEQVTEYAQNAILSLTDRADSCITSANMPEALKRVVEDIGYRFDHGSGLEGISGGLNAIDVLTNGFKKGELIVLAARPSMGKSTIAIQQAAFMSVNSGLRGLFFSLEVPERELTKKLIACTGHIDLSEIKSPKSAGSQFWDNLQATCQILKKSRLQLIDCPGIHINQIRSYARKSHKRDPIDFVFIDHIHLVRTDEKSRERELAVISSTLKAIALELHIPVIALAQLSRKVEDRTDKRPMMSDLRDSGAIEQDADIIQFVYRDDYYNPQGKNGGLIEILQRKNRNGELGDAYFQNVYSQSRVEATNRIPMYEDAKKAKRNDL